MNKNKALSSVHRPKKKYIPPKIIPLNDVLQVETACATGDGASGGPCELPCSNGNGPDDSQMI